MGVLSNITEEYFGNKVRKEDVSFRYDIDNDNPPEHTLTPDEEAFLQGLARHKLYLDKSLYFQIEDLQRHTELVISGKQLDYHMFPNRDELRREIVELEGLIKNLEEKLGRGEILPEDRPKSEELLNIWKEQRNELNKAFDSDESKQYVGLYFDNGDESKVVLLVDTIERYAKGPYETMLLMGQVMLLEYFRSFYNHVGVGTRHSLSCAESSMAEFGSLMVLKSVATSGKQIAQTAKDSLNYSRSYIAKKQLCTGLIVANGFGAYLYDYHRKDFKSLIARYANVSCLLDNSCQEALEFKYMLYPKYPPPQLEETAFEKLKKLMDDVTV